MNFLTNKGYCPNDTLTGGCKRAALLEETKKYLDEHYLTNKSLFKQIGRVMKLTFIFIMVALMNVYSNGYSQKVTLVGRQVPLEEFFSTIKQQTGYVFFYDVNLLRAAKPVTLNAVNVELPEALRLLFNKQPLDYSIENKTIVISERSHERGRRSSDYLQLNLVDITGRVVDSKGESLPGVSVRVKGTAIGTTTDAQGNFRIDAPENGVLVFSYIGFVSQEVSIQGRGSINIVLVEDTQALNEVIVIGYGTQKRSEITGAISTVQGREIASVASGDVQEALQGRMAGVDISPSTGQPGSPLDMNIRGVSTIGNGNPLFVIDGIPIMSEGGSRVFNPLASLNPSDVLSIQILKDASASAIYGARAANGVVIITTNRGASGENKVQFQSSAGVSTVQGHIDMMNSRQYIDYASEALANGGRPTPISFIEPNLSRNLSRNTDWQKELFSPGITQNYWLGISGGNENARYSFSGGYMDQEGTIPNSGFKRYSTRINSDFQLGKRWKVGESIELSKSNWTGTFDPTSPMMNQLLMSSPTTPVYNPTANGGFDGPRLEYSPVGRDNSIGLLTMSDNTRLNNKLTGNAYVEYEIIPGLTNRTNLGAEITFGKTSNFTPTYEMGDRVNTLATLTEGRNDENIYLIENITSFRHTFNKVHNINFLVGFSQQQSRRELVTVGLRSFPSNDLRTVAAGFEQRSITGNESGWALRSQMARLNYSFNDKYNLMAVIRRDGSSRFGSNNRYGVFPSISGSWVVSRESFMSKIPSVSNIMLRASYGKVGSQDINDFAQYATISTSNNVNYILGGGQGLVPGATYLSMGNSDLRWEVTTQSNIGLDIGFFNNRLSFVMDYYVKNTDGVLLQLPIPTTSGIRRANGPFVNAGALQNKGFEFTTNYQNNPSSKVNYSVSANISTNKNKVTSLGTGEAIIAQWTRGKQYATTITQRGQEIGALYGYIMEGIFRDQADLNAHATQSGSSPGDVKFRDTNKDGRVDASDQVVIGSPFPDFTYGLNSNIRYKKFDLVVFLQGKQGHDIYNLLAPSINDGEGDNNATTAMLNRWTPNNMNTNIPRAVTGNPGQNTRPSTRFIEDGSYLRIQNAQLGYSFNADRLKLSRLRLYVSGKNLYTFTKYSGYNPEIGTLFEGNRSSLIRNVDNASYPIPRTIEAGLQVEF